MGKSHAARRTEFRAMLRRNEPAILNKLMRNERRYQFGDGWKVPDWREKLQSDIVHHTAKGDARDVVILGNFAMYHGWATAAPTPTNWVSTSHSLPTPPVGIARRYWVAFANGYVSELYYCYQVESNGAPYTGWGEDLDSLHVYNGELPSYWAEQLPKPGPPVLSGSVVMDVSFAVEEVTQRKLNDDALNELYLATIAEQVKRPAVDIEALKSLVSKLNPGTMPIALADAVAAEYRNADAVAQYLAGKSPEEVAAYKADGIQQNLWAESNATTAAREYEDGEPVWIITNFLNNATGIYPAVVQRGEVKRGRWAYYVAPANDRMPVEVRQFMDGALWGDVIMAWDAPGNPEAPEFSEPTKPKRKPKAKFIMGQDVEVMVEGEHHAAHVTQRRYIGGDGWVYNVEFHDEPMKGMSVFDYIENRLRAVH